MISTCHLKAGHNYSYNRPITPFKHSENLQYLTMGVNKPKLHSKNQITLVFNFSLLNSKSFVFLSRTLSVVLQSIKVSPVTLWAEEVWMQMRTGKQRGYLDPRKSERRLEKNTQWISLWYSLSTKHWAYYQIEKDNTCAHGRDMSNEHFQIVRPANFEGTDHLENVSIDINEIGG